MPDESERLNDSAAKKRGTQRGALPAEMSDTELLLAGMMAKYRCSKKAVPHLVSNDEDFAVQFVAIREEWKARFPRLPLSATFDLP